jgi:hypothetical protein
MSIDDVSECINIDHTGPRSADNWVISNISCTDYYRFAIRISAGIEGSKIYDTRDILIRNVYGNPCVDRTNASNFVVGVQVMRGAHHITIEDSLFVNHRAKCSTGDVNGDGIALEDSRSTHDITLRNVQVYDSGDAGIDSKVAGVSIENMTVVGARHSFKVWYFNDFVCDGCVSDRARDSHIHPKDGGLPIFRNTRLWCRGDQDAKPERVINSTKSSGVTAPAGAILQSVEVYNIELCEPNPAYNFKGELNDLSGLSTLQSDLQTTPEPVNPTYRLR